MLHERLAPFTSATACRDWAGIALTAIGVLLLLHLPAAAEQEQNVPLLHIQGPGLEGPSGLNPNTEEIGQQELRLSPQLTVDELLRSRSGLTVFRRSSSINSHPTTQGASLRGSAATAASRSIVLLDGVPLNDPFGGWVYWNRAPLSLLTGIEISRGWSSLHYAPIGLNGSISLSTALPIAERAEVRLLGGSLGTVETSAAAAKRLGRTTVSAAGSLLSTDGSYLLSTGDRGAIDRRTAGEAANAALAARRKTGGGQVASAFLNAYSEEKNTGTVFTRSETDVLLAGFALEDAALAGGYGKAALYLQRQTFDSRFSSQSAARTDETPALEQHVPAETAGGSFSWQREQGKTLFISGGDARWVSGITKEDFFFDEGAFKRFREAGGNQLFFGAHVGAKRALDSQTNVSAAVRADTWRYYGLFQSTEEGGAPLSYSDGGSRSELTLNGQLTAETIFSPAWRAYSSIYNSVRSPTLNELVRPFRVRNDITLAQPELDPERLYGIESGLDYTGSRHQSSVALFYHAVEDQIVNLTLSEGPVNESACGRLAESGVCRRRGNIDWTQSWGLEVSSRYQLSRRTAAAVDYYFTRTRVRKGGELEGNELPQSPEQRLTARLEGMLDDLQWLVQLRFAGPQYEDDRNSLVLDRYAAVDLSARYRVNTALVLLFEGENVFGERIETAKTADGLVSLGPPAVFRAGFELAR